MEEERAEDPKIQRDAESVPYYLPFSFSVGTAYLHPKSSQGIAAAMYAMYVYSEVTRVVISALRAICRHRGRYVGAESDM